MRYSLALSVSVGLLALLAGQASAQSIVTVAGGGTDDGRLAVVADLAYPTGVATDASGNLYIADWDNQRVRKVSASTGIITTVAGNGSAGFTGDGRDGERQDTKHYLFSPNGGVAATGVARVSNVLVTPVTPQPAGGRKRLVRRP